MLISNTKKNLMMSLRLLLGIPGQILGLIFLITPLCVVLYVAGWLMLVNGINEFISLYQSSMLIVDKETGIVILKILAAFPVAFILSYFLTPFTEISGKIFDFFIRLTNPDFRNENEDEDAEGEITSDITIEQQPY